MHKFVRIIGNNMPYVILADFLFAILLGCLIIPRILFIAQKKKLYDMPDARKVHDAPIPRLGGLSFFPAILITMTLSLGFLFLIMGPTAPLKKGAMTQYFFLTSASASLFLLGIADDLVGVNFRSKFIVQFLAATLVAVSGVLIHDLHGLVVLRKIAEWLDIPLSIFIIVFITNAINLIDGIDGLASGLCVVSLASISVFLIMEKQYTYAMLALSTIGIVCPFWAYNVFGNQAKGHKLFMGDTGSLTLGLIISFLIINLCNIKSNYPHWISDDYMIVGFSTLIIPILDVIRLIFHRINHHRSPFLPDKNHIHHLLIRCGLRVRFVLIIILATSIAFIGLNMLMAKFLDINIIAIIDLSLYTAMIYILNRCIRKEEIKKKVAHDEMGIEFPVDDPVLYGKEVRRNIVIDEEEAL